MALIVKENKRLEHPTEPGAWFVMRVPLNAGDLAEMGDAGNLAQVKMAAIVRSLVEWSYPEPITPENIRALDLVTFNWLTDEIFAAARLRSEPEKKDSDSISSSTTAPAGGSGRKRSGMSSK